MLRLFYIAKWFSVISAQVLPTRKTICWEHKFELSIAFLRVATDSPLS